VAPRRCRSLPWTWARCSKIVAAGSKALDDTSIPPTKARFSTRPSSGEVHMVEGGRGRHTAMAVCEALGHRPGGAALG